MTRKRHTEEQIIAVLKDAQAGIGVHELCRKHGIGFFQDRHDLRFGELRLAHGNLLARRTIEPENSPNGFLDLEGPYAST